MKLSEMSSYSCSLMTVLDDVKQHPSPYVNMTINPMEIYYSYVGRHDIPDSYDKRPCIIIKDYGKMVKVFKITHETTGEEFRCDLKEDKELSLDYDSEIRFEDSPYFINKEWLRTYAGYPNNKLKAKILDKVKELNLDNVF